MSLLQTYGRFTKSTRREYKRRSIQRYIGNPNNTEALARNSRINWRASSTRASDASTSSGRWPCRPPSRIPIALPRTPVQTNHNPSVQTQTKKQEGNARFRYKRITRTLEKEEEEEEEEVELVDTSLEWVSELSSASKS